MQSGDIVTTKSLSHGQFGGASTKACVGKYGEKIYLSGTYTNTKIRINNMSDGDGKKPFVAIVDDEPDLQKLYRLAISSRGYPISYIASDGTDALEKQSKANHDQPDSKR